MVDLIFFLIGLAAWGLVALLVLGMRKLEPGREQRP